MNSNMSNISNNTSGQNESNIKSNVINNNIINKIGENEENELKNIRIESSLSLRKKKLNQILFLKRVTQTNNQNNDNSDIDKDENYLYINITEIKERVPYILTSELIFLINQ